MKKVITLAIALIAIASQAASIDWSVTGKRNTYLFDSKGEKYSGTAYLVLASDVADLTDGTFAELQSGIATAKLDSAALSDGAYAVSKKTATVSDAKLAPGTEYSFVLMFIDTAEEKYAVSSALTKPAYTSGVDADQLVAYTATALGAAGTAGGTIWNALAGGGDPDPGPGGDDPVTPDVPEPATGALALAGLALLFRRKRA